MMNPTIIVFPEPITVLNGQVMSVVTHISFDENGQMTEKLVSVDVYDEPVIVEESK